jgi:hypothetical protein
VTVLAIVLLFILIASAIYVAYLALCLSAKNQTAGAIVAATVVGGLGFAGSIWTGWRSARARLELSKEVARQKLEQALRERKRQVYLRLLRTFFGILAAGRAEDETEKTRRLDEAVNELWAMTPDLLVWSSPDIIRVWTSWRKTASAGEPGSSEHAAAALMGFVALANNIRLDLGLEESPPMDILGVFINDLEKLMEAPEQPQ